MVKTISYEEFLAMAQECVSQQYETDEEEEDYLDILEDPEWEEKPSKPVINSNAVSNLSHLKKRDEIIAKINISANLTVHQFDIKLNRSANEKINLTLYERINNLHKDINLETDYRFSGSGFKNRDLTVEQVADLVCYLQNLDRLSVFL